jgi:hypothetical protein
MTLPIEKEKVDEGSEHGEVERPHADRRSVVGGSDEERTHLV